MLLLKFGSAYASSMEALKQPTIRVIAIIAEGVPEGDTKKLIAYAKANNKVSYSTVLRTQVQFLEWLMHWEIKFREERRFIYHKEITICQGFFEILSIYSLLLRFLKDLQHITIKLAKLIIPYR